MAGYLVGWFQSIMSAGQMRAPRTERRPKGCSAVSNCIDYRVELYNLWQLLDWPEPVARSKGTERQRNAVSRNYHTGLPFLPFLHAELSPVKEEHEGRSVSPQPKPEPFVSPAMASVQEKGQPPDGLFLWQTMYACTEGCQLNCSLHSGGFVPILV